MIKINNQFRQFQNENIIISQNNNNNNINTKFTQVNTNENIYHSKNIGKNIVLCNKFILGIRLSLCLFISTFLAMIFIFIGWIVTNNFFYSIYVYIFGSIIFILTQIFFLLCFFIEPGIIPRNDPNYQEKNENSDNFLINKLKEEDINNDKPNSIFDKNYNNNDINSKENIINNNKKEKGNDINKIEDSSLPTIYTERKCQTCNIIRPPCCSHCRYCDNCVQDFDHHCFYVSNCIGKRNHKYFYLFLFFGSITSLYITIFDSFLILKIFIIDSKGIWSIIYSNDKAILIISICLISFSIIYLILGCNNFYVLFLPSGIGFILFLFAFYKNKPDNFEKFRNPFTFLVFIINIFLFFFVNINFIKQTKNIATGITIKQLISIKREAINNISNHINNSDLNKDYFTKKTKKEKIVNIFKFLFKKIDNSLVVPKRDL